MSIFNKPTPENNTSSAESLTALEAPIRLQTIQEVDASVGEIYPHVLRMPLQQLVEVRGEVPAAVVSTPPEPAKSTDHTSTSTNAIDLDAVRRRIEVMHAESTDHVQEAA